MAKYGSYIRWLLIVILVTSLFTWLITRLGVGGWQTVESVWAVVAPYFIFAKLSIVIVAAFFWRSLSAKIVMYLRLPQHYSEAIYSSGRVFLVCFIVIESVSYLV